MSRGLGVLQREILESLEPARAAQPSYDRGWVLYRRVDMRLIEGIYDLRVVAAYVRRQRHYMPPTAHNFAPMFSARGPRISRAQAPPGRDHRAPDRGGVSPTVRRGGVYPLSRLGGRPPLSLLAVQATPVC